jgi:hypothetical protein
MRKTTLAWVAWIASGVLFGYDRAARGLGWIAAPDDFIQYISTPLRGHVLPLLQMWVFPMLTWEGVLFAATTGTLAWIYFGDRIKAVVSRRFRPDAAHDAQLIKNFVERDLVAAHQAGLLVLDQLISITPLVEIVHQSIKSDKNYSLEILRNNPTFSEATIALNIMHDSYTFLIETIEVFRSTIEELPVARARRDDWKVANSRLNHQIGILFETASFLESIGTRLQIKFTRAP